MATTTRIVWISRLMLAVALLLGLAVAESVDAKIIRAQTSIKERVQGQRDHCELIGGGELKVTTYTQPQRPAGQQTVKTECSGGADNGMTCTFTPKYSSCEKARKRTRPRPGDDVAPSRDNRDSGPGEQPGGSAALPSGGIANQA